MAFELGKSVIVPKPTSAANPMDSLRVGWACIVSAMSSILAPNSMASDSSPNNSPAFIPTIPAPNMTPVSFSKISLVLPSLRLAPNARPLADQGKTDVS